MQLLPGMGIYWPYLVSKKYFLLSELVKDVKESTIGLENIVTKATPIKRNITDLMRIFSFELEWF